MSIFSEGITAYKIGLNRNKNPYSYHDNFQFWLEWDNGWQFGKDCYLFGE